MSIVTDGSYGPVVRSLVRFGRRPSFWIVAATFVLFGFAASAPSPIYAVYAARWGFSALALTEVFAVYAITLLLALLFTGSWSDSVGRRPVILGALAIEVVSLDRSVSSPTRGCPAVAQCWT